MDLINIVYFYWKIYIRNKQTILNIKSYKYNIWWKTIQRKKIENICGKYKKQ